MSIKIQELLVTLLNDMSQSKGLKSSTKETLIIQKKMINDETTIQLKNQKFKIIHFLETILEAFQTEKNSKQSKAQELSKIPSLLNALDDEQFRVQFLELFKATIESETGETSYLFPSMAENAKNMEKLDLLLHFCVTNKANLEDESLTITVPREHPVSKIPENKPKVIVKSKGAPVEIFENMQAYEKSSENPKIKQNLDSSKSDAELQTQSETPEAAYNAAIQNRQTLNADKIEIDNDHTQEESDTCSFSPISMMVLGGVIAALGIAAVAVAFTMLTGGFGIAAVVAGSVAILAGTTIGSIGFFKPSKPTPQDKNLLVISNSSESENSESESEPSFSIN